MKIICRIRNTEKCGMIESNRLSVIVEKILKVSIGDNVTA